MNGYIPVALSKSEGTGSVWVLAQLSGAHLFIQVLGNERTKRLQRARHFEAHQNNRGKGGVMAKIVGLCGSLRKNSLNRKLLNEAVRLYGACDYTELSLDLPLYDGDLEQDGRPESVETLAAKVKSADGVIIVSPEYNKGLSGVLKNALDWISRVPGGVWKDKPVAVMTAAAGRTGGETAQYMLRSCITPFGPRLITTSVVCLAQASDEFDEKDQLVSDRYITSVSSLMDALRIEISINDA